jgi:hypothetical protein
MTSLMHIPTEDTNTKMFFHPLPFTYALKQIHPYIFIVSLILRMTSEEGH